MNLLPFENINFLFLNNYFYHAPCIHFKEIEEIVNTYTESDIDNNAFDWGYNCDMDRTPVRNEDIFPFISENVRAFAGELGAKLKCKIYEPWLNTYKKGQYQEIHDHDGHAYASVIFMNDGVDFAQFYFMDRMKSSTPLVIKNIFKMEDLWYPKVNKGDIFIFPAHMLHGVSPHKSDVVRKTISFNIDLLDGELNE